MKTFEKFIDKAANLQEEAKRISFGEQSQKPKPQKAYEKKGTISAVEKGKGPANPKPPQQIQQQHPLPPPPAPYRRSFPQQSQPSDRPRYMDLKRGTDGLFLTK